MIHPIKKRRAASPVDPSPVRAPRLRSASVSISAPFATDTLPSVSSRASDSQLMVERFGAPKEAAGRRGPLSALDSALLASAARHSAALSLIPPAPLLTLSTEEFMDSARYLNSLVPAYDQYGLVTIRPPAGRRPATSTTWSGARLRVSSSCSRGTQSATGSELLRSAGARLPQRPRSSTSSSAALQLSTLPFSETLSTEGARPQLEVRTGSC